MEAGIVKRSCGVDAPTVLGGPNWLEMDPLPVLVIDSVNQKPTED